MANGVTFAVAWHEIRLYLSLDPFWQRYYFRNFLVYPSSVKSVMMEPISAIQMVWRKYKYKLQMYTGQRLEGLFLFIRELYIQG